MNSVFHPVFNKKKVRFTAYNHLLWWLCCGNAQLTVKSQCVKFQSCGKSGFGGISNMKHDNTYS